MNFFSRNAITSKRAFCLLVSCAALFTASAQADTLDKIMQGKKIRIAIDLAVPPYGMKDEKLNSTGSDVDTARLLAKDLGVDISTTAGTGPNGRVTEEVQYLSAMEEAKFTVAQANSSLDAKGKFTPGESIKGIRRGGVRLLYMLVSRTRVPRKLEFVSTITQAVSTSWHEVMTQAMTDALRSAK